MNVIHRGSSWVECPNCDSFHASTVIIRAEEPSDETWALGYPKTIGEWWIVWSTAPAYPVFAKTYKYDGQLFLLSEDGAKLPINILRKDIYAYRPLARPDMDADLLREAQNVSPENS